MILCATCHLVMMRGTGDEDTQCQCGKDKDLMATTERQHWALPCTILHLNLALCSSQCDSFIVNLLPKPSSWIEFQSPV